MYQGENFSGSAEDFVMQRKSSQEGVHVYAETGLTPRQLLQQRAELLEALKKVKALETKYGNATVKNMAAIASEAIQKAEQ